MIPMALLADGEAGEIVSTFVPDARCATRAEDLGLRVGRRVQMLTSDRAAVLVMVDESRIAVDGGVAMRIKVRT